MTSADRLERLYLVYGMYRLGQLHHAARLTESAYQKMCGRFYPQDLTRNEFQEYLSAHPDEKASLCSPYTVVERRGDKLVARPYQERFRAELSRLAAQLETCAGTKNPDGRTYPQQDRYLLALASDLRSGNFSASDAAWSVATDAPIDITIGFTESYADQILGAKRNLDCIIGLVRPEETALIQKYQLLGAAFDQKLGGRWHYPSAEQHSLLTVIDALTIAAGSKHGLFPQAFCLPNDDQPGVGKRQVFLWNSLRAKFSLIVSPLYQLVVGQEATEDSFQAHFLDVVAHELAHGFGFNFGDDSFGEHGNVLEELKADTLGLYFLLNQYRQKDLSRKVWQSILTDHTVDLFRMIRTGTETAHGRSALAQLCYFCDYQALDYRGGYFQVDYQQAARCITNLAEEIFDLSKKSRPSASYFLDNWSDLPRLAEVILGRLADLPTDIEPSFPD
jgi:hypothetical protein